MNKIQFYHKILKKLIMNQMHENKSKNKQKKIQNQKRLLYKIWQRKIKEK